MNSLKKILISYFLVLACSVGLFAQTFLESKSKGDDFFKKKDWKSAIQQYNYAIAFTPGDTYCTKQINICEQKINEEKSLQGFIAYRNKADEHFILKHYPDAKTNYERANKLKKDSYCQSQIKVCDGWIAYQKGDYKSADYSFNAIDTKDRTIEVQLILGQVKSLQGDETKALELFKKVADAGNTEGMKLYGQLLFKTGKDDFNAIQWLEKAGEDTRPYYKKMGDKMWSMAKYSDAFIYYGKAELLQSEIKTKYNDLGDILWGQNQYDDATRWYLQGGKEIKVKYYEEGIKFKTQNNAEKSEEYLQKSANADYQLAYIALGDLYWDGLSKKAIGNDNLRLALDFYEKGKDEKLNEKYLTAANIYAKDKNTLKFAEMLLNKIISQNTKDKAYADANYSLGILYWDENKYFKRDFSKTEKYLTAAGDLNHIIAQKYLAKIYFDKKRFDEAYLWYNKSYNQNTNDIEVLYALGLILIDKNIKGVKNPKKLGVEYIIKAAKMGNKPAVESLKNLAEDYPEAKTALDTFKK